MLVLVHAADGQHARIYRYRCSLPKTRLHRTPMSQIGYQREHCYIGGGGLGQTQSGPLLCSGRQGSPRPRSKALRYLWLHTTHPECNRPPMPTQPKQRACGPLESFTTISRRPRNSTYQQSSATSRATAPGDTRTGEPLSPAPPRQVNPQTRRGSAGLVAPKSPPKAFR